MGGYATPVASLEKLHHALVREPLRLQANRHAAVAAVFTRQLDLLLMRRTSRPNDPWSGHISLPGGRVEEQDSDHIEAAIRETDEEVGLRLERSQLIGALDDLAAVGGRPGMVIRPFVFLIEDPPALQLSPDEVASTRWVSLPWLLSNEGRGRMRYQREGFEMVLPEVAFPTDWEGTRLWGITLRVIDDLLHRIDGGGIGLDRLG